MSTSEDYSFDGDGEWDENEAEVDSSVRQQAIYIRDKLILTSITSEADSVRDWIREVDNRENPLRLIVGIDIKPGAPVSAASAPPIALLLLFVVRSCLIYELTYANHIPTSLYRFLSDRHNNTFVGVALQSKLAQLRRDFGLGCGGRFVDLGILTAAKYNRPEMNGAGLSELRTFLHGSDVERPWPPVVDDWDAEELSYQHVRQACIDAYTCYELGSFLVYPYKR